MTNTAVSNGENNRIQSADRGVHDWYRFVLSFPPHLIRQYLEDFRAKPGQTVLDPFCGTGTTVVEAKKQGYTSLGVEAHPMTHFASSVKTKWDIDTAQFETESGDIARQAQTTLARQGFDVFGDLPLFKQDTSSVALRHLSPDESKLLLSGSIFAVPLHKALELLEIIRSKRRPWTPHYELAFASTLVADASNLKFGPEVGVSKTKKPDADVVGAWHRRVQQMAEDMRSLEGDSFLPSTIFRGDAREQLPFAANSVHFVITSPPYPNEKDYTRTTRLESVILGFIRNRQELRLVKEGLLRSNSRNVYVSDRDDELGNQFASVRSIAEQIEAKRLELGKTSGFEKQYHRVVSLYFGGMFRHFEV